MEGVSLRSYARSRRERGLPLQTHVGLGKAIREGRLGPPAVRPDGRIDPEQADKALAELHPVEAAGTPGSLSVTEPRTFSETRLARERLRYRREHLATLQAEGRLMIAADVRRACSGAGLLLKQRLEAMPDRLAGRLCGLEAAEMHAVLTAECRDLLDDFRAALERSRRGRGRRLAHRVHGVALLGHRSGRRHGAVDRRRRAREGHDKGTIGERVRSRAARGVNATPRAASK